jgi:phosphoserine phosphatase
MKPEFQFCASHIPPAENLRLNVARSDGYRVASCVIFPLQPSGANEITGALMPNITWCDLPTDVSLWPGLPLSLSGDEVMPLDYHAGRSGWLLYGRGLDKQRLTQYQTKLGAAMVIVAAWCVEDYQVIRLAGP